MLIINNGSACGFEIKKVDKSKKLPSTRHSLKKKDFHIGFVGRKTFRKGYYLTIDLWKKHYANKDGYKLFIYGTEQIKPLDLKYIKNIFFMGFKKVNYSDMNCIILPTMHEGLPYTCMEATSHYCPVIASNIPGVSEVLGHKKNGILVNNICEMDFFSEIDKVLGGFYKNFPDKDYCDRLKQKYSRIEFLKKYSVFLKKNKG